MPTPSLSVIIPTHKRAKILVRCLEHLEKQTIAKNLEVIAVSDGHDEETTKLFRTPNSKLQIPRLFLEIPKSQQGIARNRGLEKASAPLALFIGDDIFLEKNACEAHVKTHQAHMEGIAVIGFTTWDPALEITPVMAWLEQTGWQFGYPFLDPYKHALVPAEMQHRFTYTSHISLPTVIAKRTPFREDVTLYGWEDIEWGMRLKKAGTQLFYEPDAKALHHHALTLEQSLKRMEELGESAVFLTKIAPELDRLPRGWKGVAYHILALLPTMRGQHAHAFLRGIGRGEKGAI